jgi:hypothetical protein
VGTDRILVKLLRRGKISPESIYVVEFGSMRWTVYSEDAAWRRLDEAEWGQLHTVFDGEGNIRTEFIPI